MRWNTPKITRFLLLSLLGVAIIYFGVVFSLTFLYNSDSGDSQKYVSIVTYVRNLNEVNSVITTARQWKGRIVVGACVEKGLVNQLVREPTIERVYVEHKLCSLSRLVVGSVQYVQTPFLTVLPPEFHPLSASSPVPDLNPRYHSRPILIPAFDQAKPPTNPPLQHFMYDGNPYMYAEIMHRIRGKSRVLSSEAPPLAFLVVPTTHGQNILPKLLSIDQGHRRTKRNNYVLPSEIETDWDFFVRVRKALGGHNTMWDIASDGGVYRHTIRYQRSSKTAPLKRHDVVKPGVTAVTHLSPNRIGSLERLMSRWKGRVTVMICVSDAKDCEPNMRRLAEGRFNIKVGCLAHRKTPEMDTSYPINILRNMAQDLTETELVTHFDVDFMPNRDISSYLIADYSRILKKSHNSVFILPAFEMDFGVRAPGDRKDLLKRVTEGTVRPVLQGIDEEAHIKWTDYSKWYKAEDMYEVQYSYPYEPYIIAHTGYVPRYDERFIWYGNDKVMHLFHVGRKEKFHFYVLAHQFIVHIPHEKASWALKERRAVRKKVLDLVKQFERELGFDEIKVWYNLADNV